MNWKEIEPRPSMTQTMLLDNQRDYGIDTIMKSIKMQTIYFDKLLINRAFILNNQDLVAIVKNSAKNGFYKLLESGAIALVIVKHGTPPSFIDEWKDAERVDMYGLNPDENYIKGLDQFIEGLNKPVQYLTFDYSGASQNYKSLIKNYYALLSNKDENSDIEPDDKKELEKLIFEEKSSGDFTRSKLYKKFGIPDRNNEKDKDEYKRVIEKVDKSKYILKEMFDINYNFNIPSLNKLNFEYVGTYPPRCNNNNKLYPIDELSEEREIYLIDINEINFSDIANIRGECEDQRIEYLISLEALKKRYNQEKLDNLADNFCRYLNSFSELFQKQSSHKKLKIHKSIFYFDYDYYQCGDEVFIIHELSFKSRNEEPIFKIICNIGSAEDEPRIKRLKLNRLTQNTNDTGLRG